MLNRERLSGLSVAGDDEIVISSTHIWTNRERRIPMRSAMGEYIVPPGGKPLTSLGDCLPGASDYFPKTDLTKESTPQYSIAARYKAAKPAYNASPADNNTEKGMIWKDRTSAIKGKGKMRPYDITDDAHMNDSVGPQMYRVEHHGFGSEGEKHSISSRHKDGVNAGPPNIAVQPADTKGFDTPGPNYRPNSKYWGRGTKKSFGIGHKPHPDDNPGPSDYDLGDPEGGPSYTLAKRLPPPISVQQSVNKESPGPGTYDVGTTIGKSVAKSVSSRHMTKHKDWVPAPNLYVIRDTMFDLHVAPLTYRPFERREDPHPSSANYSLTDTNLTQEPTYSIRKNTKPSFPDILNYPLTAHKEISEEPGPGSYEEKRNLSTNNHNPKYSMGKRAKTAKNEVPGANHYNIAVTCKPDANKPPAFSMGRRLIPIDKRVSPGPAAYYPQASKLSTGHSMTKRPKQSKQFVTPAPNSYPLKKGQTKQGQFSGASASFKSRCSPYVYSGFRNLII